MKRILFCVLNWGLGHATRSLPLIDYFLNNECEVQIASDGLASQYLKRRYPNLVHHDLPAYNARYSTSSVYVNSFLSAPSIHHAVTVEKTKTALIVEHWKPDLIISDNRYGCYHNSVYSILISHQLRLPTTNRLAQFVADRVLDKKLRPFDQLWVPDLSPTKNITASMSRLVDDRIKYIGLLSSMNPAKSIVEENSILLLLSGPEPARTKLEERLTNLKLNQASFSVKLIRGTDTVKPKVFDEMESLDLASAVQVNRALLQADIVVCRSGYSSIMDLLALGKKAIYIPTPGQPEQALLAKTMAWNKWGVELQEKNISLQSIKNAIVELRALVELRPMDTNTFKDVVDKILIKL